MDAIETSFRGYRFRSRLEARWAVFFDALGLPFEYEVQGFDLGGGLTYLPDFRLPTLGCWLEVKGQPPTPTERERCVQLCLQSGQPVALFVGDPYYRAAHSLLLARRFATPTTAGRYIASLAPDGSDGTVIAEGDPREQDFVLDLCADPWRSVELPVERLTRAALPAGAVGWSVTGATHDENRLRFCVGLDRLARDERTAHGGWHPFLDSAYRAARAARFEHGEHGRPADVEGGGAA